MSIKLTNSEWKIMNLLWNQAENDPYEEKGLTIKEIMDALYLDTAWSRHTIISFLKRLEAKNAVYFKRKNNAKVYYPCLDRNTAVIQDTKELLDKVYAGSFTRMVTTFAKAEELDADEIAELEKLVNKLRKK